MRKQVILGIAIATAFVIGVLSANPVVEAANGWKAAVDDLQDQIDEIELSPGPQGPPGNDGEDGTQIFGTYIVQGGQKFLDVDPTGQGSDSSIIFCEDGDILLSGGYSSLENVRLTENLPHPDTHLGAWVVTANAFDIIGGPTNAYAAYALCLDITP